VSELHAAAERQRTTIAPADEARSRVTRRFEPRRRERAGPYQRSKDLRAPIQIMEMDYSLFIPGPGTTAGPGPGLNSRGARMRRSAGKGTDGGQIGDGGASVPVIVRGTDAFHRSDGAPKARAALLPGLKAARLQPTPSPNRSPDPARQPALAPGLSLVPHGCGDPLIRLVQEPRNNRVLEGWCSSCTRQKPPRAFERPGARAGCRAGPGDRSSDPPPASRARVFPKRGLARL
jgi:hypothetical protein